MDAAWVLAPIAVGMSAIVAALVRWSTETRTAVAASVVLFLLAMMVAMFLGTWIYFSHPGTAALVIGLWVAAGLMAASVFPVFAVVLREARAHQSAGAEYVARRLRSPAPLAVGVALLVLSGELLMGRSFALAAGSAVGASPTTALAASVGSPWFLFPMAIEMGFTLGWVRGRFPKLVGALLGAQVALMAFSPPALPGLPWLIASGVGSTAAMTGGLVLLLRTAYRGPTPTGTARGYAIAFLGVGAGMAAGAGLWISGDGLAGFAAATVAAMLLFFVSVVAPERFGVGSTAAATDAPGDEPRPTGPPAPDGEHLRQLS